MRSPNRPEPTLPSAPTHIAPDAHRHAVNPDRDCHPSLRRDPHPPASPPRHKARPLNPAHTVEPTAQPESSGTRAHPCRPRTCKARTVNPAHDCHPSLRRDPRVTRVVPDALRPSSQSGLRRRKHRRRHVPLGLLNPSANENGRPGFSGRPHINRLRVLTRRSKSNPHGPPRRAGTSRRRPSVPRSRNPCTQSR